jgi:hypothetical protein
MSKNIYVPRGGTHFRCADLNGELEHAKIKEARKALANVCVRIPYKGFEISISCDDSTMKI